MKVALVHDYLKEYGGAEWVLENLHQIFPQAPVFVSYCDYSQFGKKGKYFEGWDIRSSFMQKIPFVKRMLAPLKFLSPLAFESFDLKEFDVVISSSAAYYARAAITAPSTLNLAYVHTPPRYLYGLTTAHGYKKHWWTRIGGEILNHFMRIYDFEIAQRPDILIANSKVTQSRIKKFYRRDSVVINPPVDVSGLVKMKKNSGDYFLILSRLDPHKRIDLIISVFTVLELPLKIIGTGRQENDLKKIAGKNVEFLGRVSEEEKNKLLTSAKALVLAAEDEDFGITAVEAQAAGTPVIALRRGGYLETVIEGKTGEFFNELSEESLAKAVKEFDPLKYKEADLRKNAQKFSVENFQKEMLTLVEKNLKG
jgi:glycosyltransferase involved in cell wall biosynthesis